MLKGHFAEDLESSLTLVDELAANPGEFLASVAGVDGVAGVPGWTILAAVAGTVGPTTALAGRNMVRAVAEEFAEPRTTAAQVRVGVFEGADILVSEQLSTNSSGDNLWRVWSEDMA